MQRGKNGKTPIIAIDFSAKFLLHTKKLLLHILVHMPPKTRFIDFEYSVNTLLTVARLEVLAWNPSIDGRPRLSAGRRTPEG